jgi:hypothetical protein
MKKKMKNRIPGFKAILTLGSDLISRTDSMDEMGNGFQVGLWIEMSIPSQAEPFLSIT